MGRASQEFLGSIRGLIEDATRDTTLWLRADSSAEERTHVLAMQERLADLDRIITRRMERRSLPNDGRQWSETVAEVLSLLEKAREVRGNIVGKGLARLTERLPRELPGSKAPKPKLRVPEPVRTVDTSPRSLTAVMGKAGEKKQEEKQATQLPANLQHAGDPVDGNPFPADDLRHKVWKEATLKAEEETCRVTSEFLKKSPSRQGFAEWMQQGGMASAAQDFGAWILALTVAKFDIWARRGIQVVWSDTAVQAYDQWLCNYAQNWLNAQEQSGALPHSALLDLRSRLVERVEHWKAEARGYLQYQRNELDRLRTDEKQAESARAQNNVKTTVPESANDVVSVEHPDSRRSAVDAYLRDVFEKTGKRITKSDIWRSAGYKTRAEFERWVRHDPKRQNKAAHESFMRIFREKPHLK
jgi:hypothetical protein